MREDQRSTTRDMLPLLLRAAEQSLAATPNVPDARTIHDVRSVLDRVEAATPAGAPLHAQLDNVRKWLAALERPEDHDRFGGTAHLRGYLLTQFRLARGALDDYLREMA